MNMMSLIKTIPATLDLKTIQLGTKLGTFIFATLLIGFSIQALIKANSNNKE